MEDNLPPINFLKVFKNYLGFNYIKFFVCFHFKWDYFKEDRSFTDWLFLYFGITCVESDQVQNVSLPLAELSGEISGGLANPEGFKTYQQNKIIQKAAQAGKAVFEKGKDGGMAVGNATMKGDKIVDSSGKELMKVDDLQKILEKF